MAIIRESTVALRNGRMTSRCVSAPIAAAMRDRDDEGQPPVPAPLVAHVVVHVRDHQTHRALGEVDDARSSIDEDDALRRQGVQATGPESQQREADELHAPA